eukprot:gi/632935811/ref/XP_007891357.1/ PREDICTED: ankyrin repeat domain-containing protein SOWAHD [Callorhinchus milii]
MTLDPSEHEWMLAAAGGDWEKMAWLLESDPDLLDQKDFITGLTAVHWLAKQGRTETLIALVRFAEGRAVRLDVNAKASGGYTALHLAAMQGHQMTIKLLVGAYDASVDIRDHTGRKAWQYLGGDVPGEMKLLTGAREEEIGRRTVSEAKAKANACPDRVDPPRGKPDLSGIVSLRKLLQPSQWRRRRRCERADTPAALLT